MKKNKLHTAPQRDQRPRTVHIISIKSRDYTLLSSLEQYKGVKMVKAQAGTETMYHFYGEYIEGNEVDDAIAFVENTIRSIQ